MTRTGDIGALDRVIESAALVRVHDGGNGERGPLEPEPVLVLEAACDVRALRRMLAVTEILDGMCMCLGTIALDFRDAAGVRLAAVGVHHGTHLRWSGWTGDAHLVDSASLPRWLADRGCATLLEETDRTERAAERSRVEQASWRAAAPEAVPQELLDALIAGSSTGAIPQETVAELRERLQAALPADVDRCAALCRWHAAGSGRVSGYAVHEEVPGRLIGEFPVGVVVEALLTGQDPVVRGATRHLISWRARGARELRAIPAAAWERMARAATEEVANRVRELQRRHAGPA